MFPLGNLILKSINKQVIPTETGNREWKKKFQAKLIKIEKTSEKVLQCGGYNDFDKEVTIGVQKTIRLQIAIWLRNVHGQSALIRESVI